MRMASSITKPGISEKWRPVIGYGKHYSVSNLGRVKRIMACRGATAGRILSVATEVDGYVAVQLCKNNKKKKFGVHILVCNAFHGKRPRGKCVNHKDGVKNNNKSTNLEWMTNRQNYHHARLAGRVGGRGMPGESNPRAKLSVGQVAEVLRLKGKLGQRTLAKLCGVCKTAIQKIHQGKNWPEDLRVRQMPEVRQ